nr:hypothetical protein [Desulfobulbaceae bacterium]
MNSQETPLWLVLQPILLSTKNRFFYTGKKPWKAIGVVLFCAVICLGLYLVSVKVLRFFHAQNEIGIILSLKIFEMAWILMFAMQVFSCMVSAVSTVFVSSDNEILFAAPVKPITLFGMRYWTSVFYTSWMMVVFSLPVFIAFGQVFEAGFFYWPFMLACVVSIALIGVGVALAATIFLVRFFPAKRTKDIIFYLSLCFAIFLYMIFRMLRPELLVNPDEFVSFVEYLSSVSTPSGPYVPGAWAANFLSLYLVDRQFDLVLAGLLVLTPASVYFVGEWFMYSFFFAGYSRAQESFGGYRMFSNKKGRKARGLFYMIAAKEAKQFLRDSAEWSQLFMIAALVVVYLYNFKVLPIDQSFWRQEYLANLVSFLNIGLTGFVSASLAARFVYPSVGAEGGSFYIIRSAPLSLWAYLGNKLIFYSIPFAFLSVALVLVSDFLLKISGPTLWISLFASCLIAITEVGIALGFGALFADFKAENRATALGGIGAALFLLTSFTYMGVVLGTGSIPAYRLTKQWLIKSSLDIGDLVLLGVWLVFAVGVSFWVVYAAMRKGIAHLEENG